MSTPFTAVKVCKRERPPAILSGNLFERQIAADGVELIEVRMNFADADSMFPKSLNGIFPVAAIRQKIAGKNQVPRIGESGFELRSSSDGAGLRRESYRRQRQRVWPR